MIRTYSELRRLHDFEERYQYLALKGVVGEMTFGHDRWMNQQFYRSAEWRSIRNHVISRDQGCDLGIEGYEIHSKLLIHHMNPVRRSNLTDGDVSILDPEFLITTTQRTHNAIHFGDERLLPGRFVERTPGDTKLW
jgi:hypothetical protein